MHITGNKTHTHTHMPGCTQPQTDKNASVCFVVILHHSLFYLLLTLTTTQKYTQRHTQAADEECVVKIKNMIQNLHPNEWQPHCKIEIQHVILEKTNMRQVISKMWRSFLTLARDVKYFQSCQSRRHNIFHLSIWQSVFLNHFFPSPSHLLIDPCQLTLMSISTNKHPHWQEHGTKCCEHNLCKRLLVSSHCSEVEKRL